MPLDPTFEVCVCCVSRAFVYNYRELPGHQSVLLHYNAIAALSAQAVTHRGSIAVDTGLADLSRT